MINIMNLSPSMTTFLVRNYMIKRIGEYDMTVEDMAKKRKRSGKSYKVELQQYNELKKL